MTNGLGSKWTVKVSVKFLKVFSAGFPGDSRFPRRLYVGAPTTDKKTATCLFSGTAFASKNTLTLSIYEEMDS